MFERVSRRRLLSGAVSVGAPFLLLRTSRADRRSEKLNVGVIGVGGQGGYSLDGVAAENVVALCDVDENNLARAAKRFPDARTYTDYRRLVEQKGLDAVAISTPDHTHATATAAALQAGLHVYCEKPLTHSVYEARRITELARQRGLATQLGTQIHSGSNYRRVVELVRAGVIGDIFEVHVWCDRVSPEPELPTDRPPVPQGLHWDLWIGPARMRPYHPTYCPHHWRWWWEFGNGVLGDMGCHHIDLPFWALGLTRPLTVEAEGPPVHSDHTPPWLIVRYSFAHPQTGQTLPLTWYHGGKRPRYFTDAEMPRWGDGTLFVGTKGMLLADYGRRVLLPEARFKDINPPPASIPESPGHHAEWLQAIRTGGKPSCSFDYSGPLTEAVLLGCVAYRSGAKLEWDAEALKIPNAPEAERYLQRSYRRGWKLG